MTVFFLPLAVHAALVQQPLSRGVANGARRTAVAIMSEVPSQWQGPAVKRTANVTQAANEIKELLQEEETETTFMEQVPRLEDLEAMVSEVDPEAVALSVQKSAFFLKAWAKEKSVEVQELATKAKELELDDIKAAVSAKAPEVKAEVQAEVQAKAEAASKLVEQLKSTEAVRAAADKTAAAYQALEESNAVTNIKESYAKVRKSEAYKVAVDACADMSQVLRAKAEEAELVPKARAALETVLGKVRAARLALVELIEEALKGK